jgi:hypothetical protein
MDDLVKEVIPLLQYLIPGFVSTWIFYTLTSFKRPDTFGQIVQALIFTFVIHGVVLGIGAIGLWVGSKGFSVGNGMAKPKLCGRLLFQWGSACCRVLWLRMTNCTNGYEVKM